VPLIALVVAGALAIGVLASSGGGDQPSKHQAASAAKNGKKPGSGHQTPATPQAATPPAATGYQLPQPSGTSAADGWRLNTQGKALSDRGDNASAIPVLEHAVRSYPPGTTAAGDLQYAYTLFNLGHALLAGGRPADAVPVLEERLKNPDQQGAVQAELDAARQAASQG
jgi:serine/threonine-protein kinase